MSEQKQIGRLAMRVEGQNWVGYYANMDTLEGAVLLGTINMHGVADPRRREMFLTLMREMVADILEEKTGHRPSFITIAAPEHERSKS